jgi:cytoskeletal protein CcmA (bactofilin family)
MFNKFKNKKTDHDVTNDIVYYNENVGVPPVNEDQPSDNLLAQQKPTLISEGAVFDGNLQLDGILHLDGKFKGIIKANKVTIGRNGIFDGKLETEILNVLGKLKGDVICRELQLSNDSKVSGNIVYSSIRVHPGASISGELICKSKP